MKDARKWTRLLGDAVGNAVTVTYAGHVDVAAHVVDESVDGLAILVPQWIEVREGDRIQIAMGNVARDGIVCHVAPSGVRLRVGIRFDSPRESRQLQDTLPNVSNE